MTLPPAVQLSTHNELPRTFMDTLAGGIGWKEKRKNKQQHKTMLVWKGISDTNVSK